MILCFCACKACLKERPACSNVKTHLFVSAPSPPRRFSIKFKEGTRLVLQWRKPKETNGIIKKYDLHFTDSDGVTKTYTMHSNVDKDFLTYEMTLPDVEAEFKIKVSGEMRL